jgi:hypothetical protein
MNLCTQIPLGLEQFQYEIYSKAISYFGHAMNYEVLELNGPKPCINLWIEPIGNITGLSVGLFKVLVTTLGGTFVDQINVQFCFDKESQITGLRIDGQSVTSTDVFNRLIEKIPTSV